MASKADLPGGVHHCPDCGNFANDEHECPDLSGEGEIPACPDPDCESTAIQYLSSTGGWYCSRCKEAYDEPEYRVRKKHGVGLNGSQQILWEADPSEYP